MLSLSVGDGRGLHAPLSAGDQVFVIPHEGYANHGVIIGRAFSNVAPSYVDADTGEPSVLTVPLS